MKQKLTLNIDDTLIEKMKIQAVLNRRSVSDITEELYRGFLGPDKKQTRKRTSASRKH